MFLRITGDSDYVHVFKTQRGEIGRRVNLYILIRETRFGANQTEQTTRFEKDLQEKVLDGPLFALGWGLLLVFCWKISISSYLFRTKTSTTGTFTAAINGILFVTMVNRIYLGLSNRLRQFLHLSLFSIIDHFYHFLLCFIRSCLKTNEKLQHQMHAIRFHLESY